jgi:competence protein CoiA
MLYASLNNEKIEAKPKVRANCPLCEKEVFSKCGEINVWHWAHLQEKSCDNWYEPETAWHKDWKNIFGKDVSEIIITKNGKKHIADIFTKEDIVIELQNSPISKSIINKREIFYGERMLWIINGANFKNNFNIIPENRFFGVSQGLVHKSTGQLLIKGEKLFNWKWSNKSWKEVERPVFIDFGEENLICIVKGMGTSLCVGIFVSKKKFLEKYLK